MRKHLGFIFAAIVGFVVLIMILGNSAITISAEEKNPAPERHFESITVQANDTLWDYGEMYAEDLQLSVSDYVALVMRMNNMTSDRIITGSNIILVWAVPESTLQR